jgi:hypothetical protein
MVKLMVAGIACVLMAGCSDNRPVAVSPTPSATADSPAASVKLQAGLLYGEHVFIVAKLSLAAATGGKDEFHAYAVLLAANGADLAAMFSSALGATEGAQLGRLWMQANTYFVDYMVAAATHDKAKSDAAMTNLNDTYAPQMAQWLQSSLRLPLDATQSDERARVAAVKLVVDDAVAANHVAYFADLRRAYSQAAGSGATLAAQLPVVFPDKFPGDPSGAAVQRRVDLVTLMQERAYLSSMATGAAVAGAKPMLAAAKSVLAANAADLARLLDADSSALFAGQTSSLLAYAAASDDATRQTQMAALNIAGASQLEAMLSTRFHAAADVKSQIGAEIQVADDQRIKAFDRLATDDRHAAVLLSGVGDAIALARG